MTTQIHDSERPAVNADQAELDKFSALASRWWDPESEFKPVSYTHLTLPTSDLV